MKKSLIFLIILLAAVNSPHVFAKNKTVFTVGVVPQFEIRHLRKIWNPIISEIQKHTGYQLKFIGSPTIEDFGRELNAGRFDFAYMNPYQFIITHKAQGYIPLVRDTGRLLQGIIVVRRDSPIKSLQDLSNKKIAFPSPNAFAASLLIRANLANKFNIHFNPVYVKTHSSVYLNVLLQQTDAGGGIKKTLSLQKDNIKGALRILHKTPGVPPHLFAVHPRVSRQAQQNIKNTLLLLGKNKTGQSLLARIPIKKIGITKVSDYNKLKKLQLEKIYVE